MDKELWSSGTTVFVTETSIGTLFRYESGGHPIQIRIALAGEMLSSWPNFLELSQPSNNANKANCVAWGKHVMNLFCRTYKIDIKLCQHSTRWIEIDRDRFLSVTGPRIRRGPQKTIKKSMNNYYLLILPRISRITMISDNNGSSPHPKSWLSIFA